MEIDYFNNKLPHVIVPLIAQFFMLKLRWGIYMFLPYNMKLVIQKFKKLSNQGI